MGKIEVRAWNKVKNEMITDAINNCKDSFEMILKHPQIYEVLNGSGLPDKNNVKIYEGHIVKTYRGDIGVVKLGFYQEDDLREYFDYDIEEYFIDVNGDERKAYGFYIQYRDGTCNGLDNKTDKWVEIIGDIYENPKLLG